MGGNTRGGARTLGFTLLEATIALTLLALGLLGFASVLVANARSHDTVNEDSAALQALRETAEEVRGTPFREAASRWSGSSAPVEALSGTVRVKVFLNETDGSTAARELGLPRDLNGDGAATSPDVSGTYLLLPVEVSVSWSNPRGPQAKTLRFLLAQQDA